ncbi:MAG: hypothetical protein V4674_02120 [Patescibacteria group bacterium]
MPKALNLKPKTYREGQIVLLSVFFMVLMSLGLLLGGTVPLVRETQTVRDISHSRDAYYWAEGAVEDVVYRIKKGYSVGSSVSVPIDGSNVVVTVTDVPGSRIVSALGDKNSDRRRVQATVVAGTGISFSYGIQVGSQGIFLDSNAVVNGSIYTNGSAEGENGSAVTGSLFAVGSISSPDPEVTGQVQSGAEPLALPEVDIDSWKSAANVNNNPIVGDVTYSGAGNSLGPRKVVGNMTLSNGATLTVTGPLHITGNLILDNNSTLKLDSSFGSAGTAIIVDGEVTLYNNALVLGTGATPKGYLLILSTSSSANAIKIDNNGNAQAYFYAYNGTIVLDNNAGAMAIVGQRVVLNNGAEVNYEIGLAHPQFSSGPGGTFEVKGWKETE